MRALNILHVDRHPEKPAVVPYAVAIGNHDYDTSQRDNLSSTVFEKNLGLGRFRDPQRNVKEAIRDWFKGDDLGCSYVVDGKEVTKGTGRNSWQVFTAGGTGVPATVPGMCGDGRGDRLGKDDSGRRPRKADDGDDARVLGWGQGRQTY